MPLCMQVTGATAGHCCYCASLYLQVDALKMEGFIDSFVDAIGLARSYTLLVLNPKWSPSLPSYTYRIGFSEAELRLLHEQVMGRKGQLPKTTLLSVTLHNRHASCA